MWSGGGFIKTGYPRGTPRSRNQQLPAGLWPISLLQVDYLIRHTLFPKDPVPFKPLSDSFIHTGTASDTRYKDPHSHCGPALWVAESLAYNRETVWTSISWLVGRLESLPGRRFMARDSASLRRPIPGRSIIRRRSGARLGQFSDSDGLSQVIVCRAVSGTGGTGGQRP